MQLSFADWQKIKNVNKNKQVVPDSVVQWSTPWVVFLWRPIKGSLVCGFSSSLCMIILNLLPLCSSRSHKYNNYDTPTYIVSSNLCLFICLQPTDFPWNRYPQRHISCKEFPKFIPLFLMLTFQIIYQYPRPEST